ncbi:hypothetical protein AB8U03_13540 [Clostridium sp. Mt-5]|uniref:Peptidase S74 domain-containing protein n=1 Tax=Clostridium moutaii TaxID=3240932 RepID=A0ABV4BQZ1_9CLOT
MLAIKENKQLKIDEKDKAYYLTLGYDIADVDEKGNLKILENAPGKTVTYAKYEEALSQIADLEKQVTTLKKAAK